ncbi:MAG: ATP-binding protein [Crocinitomicaceae bacterium]|nr:ATP-binding protein [Crocinitomicaceae bacterium]
MKIAITGPESSGKTTLAVALASHYDVNVIPEYAREFLKDNGPEYTQPDLDDIAEGHAENLQIFYTEKSKINIVDTDFVVIKVRSEHKYNFASTYINELVSENHFDLHVLCAPDIPWEVDPLRENPDDRHILFEKYISVLNSFKKDFIIVNGSPEERLKKSIEAIDRL